MSANRIASLLAFCAIALTACGGSEDTSQPTGGSAAPAPSPAPAPGPGPAPAPAPVTASATLQWTASADSRVVGYRVYYGTVSRTYQAKGGGLDAAASNTFVVSNLSAGATYYFAVTAYDAAGNESDFSSEVAKQVQ